MLFQLGQTVATRNALNWMSENDVNPISVLSRHILLDPGCLDAEDQQLNRTALQEPQGRIFSAYVYNDQKLYVITEWDRSVTTIMLAEDY